MIARRRINDGAQVRVNRNAQLDSGLLLLDGKYAVANMLAPHSKNVAPALACVEPEGESQSSLRANTVRGLVSGNVLFTPGVNAVAFRGLELMPFVGSTSHMF